LKNSGTSRRSKRGTKAGGGAGGWLDLAGVALLLVLVSASAAWFHYSRGHILWFGDAEAHLNIARRVIDNRQPGFDQIGTVWLPLPHLLMLPLVRQDELWRTGLAGTIPSAAAFVIGGLFLYAAARRVFGLAYAAFGAVLLYALNPNLLYLQSIPMTESPFFAALLGLLYATVWHSQSSSAWAAVLAGVASCCASLTRYEGWFLIPFVALYLAFGGQQGRFRNGVLFGAIAALPPLFWLGYNYWHYGNPLEFYNGYYSAKMIYQRALESNMRPYPGDHDLRAALRQYQAAAQLGAGPSLAILALGGLAVALVRRWIWPVVLLLLPGIFYVWSIYGSGTPIFVPHLEPFSYYNTRYGLGMLPLFAFGGAALMTVAPRVRWLLLTAVVLTAIVPWVAYPRPEGWITWKESQVNSEKRRAWTREAAAYLKQHYAKGDGIYANFGDLTGILREAGIPIAALLHDGVSPSYNAVEQRPDLFLREAWAIAFGGDNVSQTLIKSGRGGHPYVCVKLIEVKGEPVVEIYRRADIIGEPKRQGSDADEEPETDENPIR
jgi:hypothetical protein